MDKNTVYTKIKELEMVVVNVKGLKIDEKSAKRTKLRCMISNNKIGKTLSIDDGKTQFTIPFEAVEKYLR